jgi:two-component system phosphate regulon sensor histidine kinase PhoR
MRTRLYKSMTLVVIIVELICIFTLTVLQNRSSINETKQSLRGEAEYVAAGYTSQGTDFLKLINRKDGDRITIIDRDGTVIFDSVFKASKMGNHSDRPEVKNALKHGSAYSIRYSEDLREETIYYAKVMGNGKVLRMCAKRISLWQLYMNLKWELLALIGLSVLITMLLTGLASRSLIRPINEIDLQDPLSRDTYPEIRPLVVKIDEQNRQIAEQIDELKEAVEQKTKEADFRKEFTANVSHEMKTPLTSISGFAELIKTGVAKPEDIKPFAGRIYDEAERMRSLVDDIMTISKLDEGDEYYTKEDVDLYAVCEQVISDLAPVASKKNVSFELTGYNTSISGVESILYEMIFNICDNAIRYNVEGGRVMVEVSKRSVRPYVRVEDTGIGIPREDQNRVFERFYMVNKSHSRETGGTGLGLAIVKHGAKFHNADIRLESEPGKGTVMTILF